MKAVQCDGAWHVVTDDGRILAVFDQGRPSTQQRHAELWAAGTFDRDEYEEDLKVDFNWTGKHILKQ
jgi:hypothetical protein